MTLVEKPPSNLPPAVKSTAYDDYLSHVPYSTSTINNNLVNTDPEEAFVRTKRMLWSQHHAANNGFDRGRGTSRRSALDCVAYSSWGRRLAWCTPHTPYHPGIALLIEATPLRGRSIPTATNAAQLLFTRGLDHAMYFAMH